MEISKPQFQKHLYVCENIKEAGICCSLAGMEIRECLKTAVKDQRLADKIRVSRTGCLGVCEQGPNVLLMPDNVWFKQVSKDDVPKILEQAMLGVTP